MTHNDFQYPSVFSRKSPPTPGFPNFRRRDNAPQVRSLAVFGAILIAALFLSACGAQTASGSGTASSTDSGQSAKPTIAVTYSILGAVVGELVGDRAAVKVVVPNGLDVHEWEPSAQDIEALLKADLIVENGLGLEEGLEKVLERAREQGVHFFTAADHIAVRHVGKGEGIPGDDEDQAEGAEDPHIWTDPVTLKMLVPALAKSLKERFGTDLESRAAELIAKLDEVDSRIASEVAALPAERRVLVTGHESLGYFAQRYTFRLSGAIIPNLSTQAGVSAADMAALSSLVKQSGVKVVFTEIGTPPKVAEALASEAKVKLVELSTHALPPDGSYFTFIQTLADDIIGGLR